MRAGKGSCWYFYDHRTDQVDNNWRTITQTLQMVAGYCLKFEITPPRRVPSRAELHTWSSVVVIDQEVSNMLACGVIVEVDPAESGFSLRHFHCRQGSPWRGLWEKSYHK